MAFRCVDKRSENTWQFPQVGIEAVDNGCAKTAALRELREEIGIAVSSTISSTSELHTQNDSEFLLVGHLGDSSDLHVEGTERPKYSYVVPPGTWLERAGYIGQAMQWLLIHYKVKLGCDSLHLSIVSYFFNYFFFLTYHEFVFNFFIYVFV